MIGIAIIGYGYWGTNLARNFARRPDVRIVTIVDPDKERRTVAGCKYPDARAEADAGRSIASTDVDAVVIATPPSQHRALALAALEAGKHVLVEKPFTTSLGDARAIVTAADRSRRILMVDHTFIFAPAVEALAAIVRNGDLGELIHVESTRTNLARFDLDVGVIRDLAVHDLSILDHVLGASPALISARGASVTDDFAFLSLDYAGVPAHLHVDCISPVKIRRMVFGGTRGLAVYDDIEPIEKVRVYQRGDATRAELRVGFRSGAISSPVLALEEPLARMADHFIRCIAAGSRPASDGANALRLLAIIETAERLIAQDRALIRAARP